MGKKSYQDHFFFISVEIDLYYDTKQITISVKPKGFCSLQSVDMRLLYKI